MVDSLRSVLNGKVEVISLLMDSINGMMILNITLVNRLSVGGKEFHIKLYYTS